MAAEKELLNNVLGIESADTALEIMRDEGNFICLLAREVETIETDPEKAYSEYGGDSREKTCNHMVFCGNPFAFLKKKISEKAQIDIILVNADRLKEPRKIWNMIGTLNPSRVILCYRESRKGVFNKKLMVANGFKITKQEVEFDNGISEKFCVGCSDKCDSD